MSQPDDPTKKLVERLLSGKPTPLEREAGEALRTTLEALERLGSMEAFCGPRWITGHDSELLARIDFARAAIKAQQGK